MTHVTMWDTVDPAHVPHNAEAYAGYTDGHWPSYPQLHAMYGDKRPVLSITVTGADNAHVVDVESGDVTVPHASGWIKRQQKRGYHRPCVYCSLSVGQVLVPMLASFGVRREDYRLWLGHWTGRAHLCGPECGWHHVPPGATQWTSNPRSGWHADLSLTTLGWLHAVQHDHETASQLDLPV